MAVAIVPSSLSGQLALNRLLDDEVREFEAVVCHMVIVEVVETVQSDCLHLLEDS